ncbi:opacity protein-like surface antigen [Neorhizobium huautlense]|uniref:Opacity protein-like surface antigen n=1 Tax=Neorhizobium huautlense TaxID=67774 RepID=A0ABT9PY87_9HYPH|nr:acyloxyacyl hydrolase [Neorhizobium huautlense]MDP9839444.1 opacity protein-like surface antigen [Neorhizobium huautlense]
MTRAAKSKSALSVIAAAGALMMSASASFGADMETTQKPIFDEIRFGALVAVDKTPQNDEKGAFVKGMVFFDPWNHDEAQGLQKLVRPRVHVGADIATANEASQIYAGFSWTANITDFLFLEAGFGGSLNNGNLELDGTRGPKLGCHTLFHEYAAVGVNLDPKWRIVGQIEHSSHANLCGEPNNGLTRAGVLVGYKF